MEDSALIRACQNGDKQAFGLLYDRTIRPVYSFVYYKTRHKETAEDLTSEAFFKALKSIRQCDPERPFMAWMYAIAGNTVRDHYRTKKNRLHAGSAPIEDAWDLTDDTDILADAEMKLLTKSVAGYLGELSSKERDIIIMRIWQELSYQEIADILGTSQAASKMAFSRALGKLRQIMPPKVFSYFLLLNISHLIN